MASKGSLLGNQSRSKEQLKLDYYVDLYHGDGKCWGAEKVPLLTFIWMRKIETDLPYETSSPSIQRSLVILARSGLSIIYFCSAFGASFWMLRMRRWIDEIMDYPESFVQKIIETSRKYPDDEYYQESREAAAMDARNMSPWNTIGGVGIFFVVVLTIFKDLQKCAWWLLASLFSYCGKNLWLFRFLVILDFFIVISTSIACFLWIEQIVLTNLDSSVSLVFQLTTIPGFLFLQEIDERLGNFLKSGGKICSDPNDFNYIDETKKTMYCHISKVRTLFFFGFSVFGIFIVISHYCHCMLFGR